MSIATLNTAIKAKKLAAWVLSNGWWNHPHRLASIDVSGTLDYTIDERDFTSPGLTANVYVFDLDFSGASGYTRIFEDKTPWRVNNLTPDPAPAGAPAAGELILAHRPRRMWQAASVSTAPSAATIGTCTETAWSRPSVSDPWVEGASSTTDIDFYFSIAFSAGGEPDSQGRGDSSDDERLAINFGENFSGTNSFRLPALSGFVYRLPWNDSWASETTVFSDLFDDHLTAENAADGGGHSGTCTLSLDFT